MDTERSAFLDALLAYGEKKDSEEGDRLRRYRNITRDTGEFLALWVHALPARRILEIGTSNGYSTIWLADAVERHGGRVVTIDDDLGRAEEAARNFTEAGLSDVIEQIRGRAQEVLPGLAGPPFDLIFLDAERSEYLELWPALEANLRRERGLLVIDNAVSHEQDISGFVELLTDHPDFVTSLAPVGKGEFLALRVS